MKKNIKKCFALILALCMMIAAVPASAASISTAASAVSRGKTILYVEDKSEMLKSNMKSATTQWRAQNPNIAYIKAGQKGSSIKVYAKKTGTTHIYAITKNKTGEKIEVFTIVVKKRPAIKISCTSKTVKKGSYFIVELNNANISNSISLDLNDKFVKIVNILDELNGVDKIAKESVQFKALKRGTTTITFTTGGKKYSCKIIVK